jgi:pimeloyl-ACP methyl ester carboxylesterase
VRSGWADPRVLTTTASIGAPRSGYARQVRNLLVLVAVAGLGVIIVFSLQRRLLYFPDRSTEAEALARAGRAGLVPWRTPVGALRGWRRAGAPVPRGRVLVLHGNAGSALDRTYYVDALAPLGLDVVLLEYPGYGARPGAPALGTLTGAAVEAVDAALQEAGPVWLVGESLGSGVAARAAAQRPEAVRGLILVTPFAELAGVARLHYGPIAAALLRDRFAPARDLAAFRHPIVVLVAGRDEVVGAEQGRALFRALPGPKRLVEQPGATHNGLDLAANGPFWAEAMAFLEAGRGQ